MRIIAPGPALAEELRAGPPGKEFDIRAGDDALVYVATLREAEILNHFSAVDGVGNRRRLKFLRLRIPVRAALALVRRMLCSTARTVCEASQLTVREIVPGGGIVYSHFKRRTNTYAPRLRQGLHPTYAALRTGES